MYNMKLILPRPGNTHSFTLHFYIKQKILEWNHDLKFLVKCSLQVHVVSRYTCHVPDYEDKEYALIMFCVTFPQTHGWLLLGGRMQD